MDVDPIHLAIPVFFALIGVELLAARLLERDAYRLSDSIADLSCGVLQQEILRSFNPVRANLQVWVDIARKAGRTRHLRDAARLLWARPGWAPADLGGFVPPPEVDASTYVKHDPPVPGALRAYVLVQFAVLTGATTAFLFAAGGLSGLDRAAGGLAVVLELASLGGLLDGQRWALQLEPARLALAPAVLVLLPVAPGVRIAGLALAVLSGVWLLRVRGGAGGTRAPLPAP
jgi:alkylglycerol monooxygenase